MHSLYPQRRLTLDQAKALRIIPRGDVAGPTYMAINHGFLFSRVQARLLQQGFTIHELRIDKPRRFDRTVAVFHVTPPDIVKRRLTLNNAPIGATAMLELIVCNSNEGGAALQILPAAFFPENKVTVLTLGNTYRRFHTQNLNLDEFIDTCMRNFVKSVPEVDVFIKYLRDTPCDDVLACSMFVDCLRNNIGFAAQIKSAVRYWDNPTCETDRVQSLWGVYAALSVGIAPFSLWGQFKILSRLYPMFMNPTRSFRQCTPIQSIT